MENLLFVILVALVSIGLILTGVTLLQIKRNGGFEKAMKTTPEGKSPSARILFVMALVCYVAAMLISFID